MRGRWRRARAGPTNTSVSAREGGPRAPDGGARWDHGGTGLRLRDGRTVPHVFPLLGRGIGLHPVGAAEAPDPVLLLHGPGVRADPRAAPDVVPAAAAGLRQRARVAGAEAGGARRAVHQARQRVSVARGLSAGPALCRSVCQPPWVARLDRYARRVNPLLADVLTAMSYYWVTTQAEYATDLVFKSRQHLAEFFPPPAGAQHAVLLGSGRPELPGAEVARQVRRRGGNRSV